MNPSLIAIFGPLKGSSFEIGQDEISIGREPSNRLVVTDPLLSRKHCVLIRNDENFTIRDLNSRNGIFVNGLPIKEKILQHGDQIQMGDSLFVFVLDQVVTEASEVVTPSDESPVIGSTTQLRIEDAMYLNPEKLLAAIPGGGRVARDLNALLSISSVINSIQNPNMLQSKLLELLLEILPAERGTIRLTAGKSSALNKSTGSVDLFRVSRSIADEVLNKKIALLANDIQQSESLRDSKSLTASNIHSLLCVPLAVYDKVLGFLYVDSSHPTTEFDEGHLQFVTAVSAIAAVTLKNSLDMQWLVEENKRLQTDAGIEHCMIGESLAIRKIYELIAKVAQTDSTVLICGESGTGKELAAYAIHRNSARAEKPFIAINCAAVVETLLESELFGHEKGSFTGAIAQKKGKLEIAEGGTVFLDEITELSPGLQAKLLRVLQQREFDRVGGSRPIHVDVRFIAATNRNLEEAVKTARFRNDLYYRLNVVTITMPPLRERREDIPLLASYFAAEYGKKFNRRIKGISPEAREILLHYDWPGNVRELQNAIERAVVLGSTELILQEDLPETLLEIEHSVKVPSTRYHQGVKEAKKELIRKALAQSSGHLNEAAAILGVNLTYLYRLIRNLRLEESKQV